MFQPRSSNRHTSMPSLLIFIRKSRIALLSIVRPHVYFASPQIQTRIFLMLLHFGPSDKPIRSLLKLILVAFQCRSLARQTFGLSSTILTTKAQGDSSLHVSFSLPFSHLQVPPHMVLVICNCSPKPSTAHLSITFLRQLFESRNKSTHRNSFSVIYLQTNSTVLSRSGSSKQVV